MNIIELEILNQKTIRCFQKVLDGDNLEVAGETATGKTTAVSALWEVLKKGNDTLTHGEHKGTIRVTLGDKSDTVYVAERVNTPKTSQITITKFIDGRPMPVNTKDFEQMLSKLSVNPHKIAEMKPKERALTLLSAAEIEIDLDALDEEIKEAEGERLYVKRAADDAKPANIPEKVEPVNVADLIAERDKVVDHNIKIANAEQEMEQLEHTLNTTVDRVQGLLDELEVLEKTKAQTEERIAKGKEWFETHIVQNTEPLDEQIAKAEETNKLAAVYEQAVKDQENHAELVDKHAKVSEQVKELNTKRKAALDKAKWPLEGLAVTDGDVYYNEILFDNLGESEQMLVTAAIALGDIEKHPVKIVRMDGVESMSQKDYEALRDLFNSHGVQVLSSRVSRNGAEESEIEIIDGIYKEADDGDKAE